MSLIRQSIWAASAAVTLAASRFALVAVLARRLSVSAFGQFAYGQWLVDLTFLVCSFGATAVASRYLAEYRHDNRQSSAIARRWLPFAFGLPVLAGLAAPIGWWLSGLALSSTAGAMLAVWTIANGLWAMQSAALAGLQRFDLVFVSNAIGASVMVAGAVAMPLDAKEPGPVFGLLAVSAFAAALVGLEQTTRIARAKSARMDARLLRLIRQYAFNMWLTSLLWSLVWSRGEMPIVRAQLGDDGVAHYTAALTFFGGAIQGVMLMVAGTAPHLTRLWGEGARAQSIALARRIMDTQLIICCFASAFLICFSPELMEFAFGAAYRGESGTLAILGPGVLAMAVALQSHLLQIETNARLNRDLMLVGAAILLASAGWLVGAMGLSGASIARASTMLLLAFATLWLARRRWGPESHSNWNVVSALLVVATCSTAVVLWRDQLEWTMRLAIACFASGGLALVVRDAEGRMHAGTVVVQALEMLFARPPRVRKPSRD